MFAKIPESGRNMHAVTVVGETMMHIESRNGRELSDDEEDENGHIIHYEELVEYAI